jgi:CRP/FNR family cyclic AMP-dependent transcriptional regulator
MGDSGPRSIAAIPPELVEKLTRDAPRLQAKSGRTLISQGEASTTAYYVMSGRLQVMLFSLDGRAVIIRDIGPGAIFGELAALDGRSRSATIVAMSDCVLACLDAAAFRAAIEATDGGWLWLARRLTGQVRDLTDRLLRRMTLRVASRLHCELLEQCGKLNVDGGRVVIEPAPKHADLAAVIGTHREAVTREIGYLARRGIIERQPGRIIVNDTRALARLVRDVAPKDWDD